MPKIRTQQEANEEVEREGYKLLSEYKGANSLVTLQCPNGHIYEAQFNSFHKGRRCKFCSNTNVKYVYEQVKEYVESQGDELLSTEYINNKNKLKIKCCHGHEYERRYDKYRQGQRCPICSASSGEQTLYYILEKLDIEFDGSQHFKPNFGDVAFGEIIYHDAIKNAYCEDNNINILRIPFWEFGNMEEIVKNKINELIKTSDGQVS